MEKKYDVVVAGHMCLDLTPVFPDTGRTKVTEIFKPGTLINVDPAHVSLGGPVSNTGLAIKHFGMRVLAIAGVGDDDFGAIAQRLLKVEGAGDAIKPTPGATTSYTVVLAPPGIDRMFCHCPGKNDTFQCDDIDFGMVRQARMFHLGYPPLMRSLYENEGRQLTEIFRRAKECDVTTSIDMSLPDPSSVSGQAPWEKILENTLPYIDIFIPSIEEIYYMLERESYLALRDKHPQADLLNYVPPADYARLAEKALALGCGMCVIKTGNRGYYLRTKNAEPFERFGSGARCNAKKWGYREFWTPAYKVPHLASATGSGDSSIAGFLTAYLHGYDPNRCMQLACAAGHHNLQALDALSGLPEWDVLERFIDREQILEDPLLEDSAFEWDPLLQIYRSDRDGKGD